MWHTFNSGDERAVLTGLLGWHRETLERECEGVSTTEIVVVTSLDATFSAANSQFNLRYVLATSSPSTSGTTGTPICRENASTVTPASYGRASCAAGF